MGSCGLGSRELGLGLQSHLLEHLTPPILPGTLPTQPNESAILILQIFQSFLKFTQNLNKFQNVQSDTGNSQVSSENSKNSKFFSKISKFSYESFDFVLEIYEIPIFLYAFFMEIS